MTRRATSQLPAQLAECLRQSKRPTQELQMLKQDLDIAMRAPRQDNLSMVHSRSRLVRDQSWGLERLVSEMNDAISAAEDYYRNLDKYSLPSETR